MRSLSFRLAVLAAALTAPLAAGTALAADRPTTPSIDLGVPTVDDTPAGDVVAGEEVAAPTALGYRSAAPLVLRYPGSTYVKVHFNALDLAPGDRVTVADPTGREVHTYHGDPTAGGAAAGDSSYTIHRTRGFAAMSIDGDTAVVTLHRAGSARQSAVTLDRAGLGVRVDRVWRGFDAVEYRAHNRAVCGQDARKNVVCYKEKFPTEYARGQAVARAQMKGSGYCTAWRVGNTNRMLTNNHCIGDAATAKATEFQFAYQCDTCTGTTPGAATKVSGVEMFKTNKTLDYTLVSVNDFEKIKSFGTLYLDPRKPTDGETIYIPGHGDAKPNRLSIFEEPDEAKRCSVYRTQGTRTAYNCDTSGGNSGSPVLAQSTHKVIVLHNTGSCPNNNGGNAIVDIFPEIQSMIDNNPPA
ncbi:hypothetical protein GCM10010123_42000 [Pilimelia anulata]|uniref:Serine protease n=1 Tax=Pilimelia anulata TaxID=53371 RepID=A0A8J3BJC7_9ACTN|nr:serine protease [Pilimelia anulata]GGK07624.1 hypothetical protein GCM10010123_42000 [Pilimelia anulata]